MNPHSPLWVITLDPRPKALVRSLLHNDMHQPLTESFYHPEPYHAEAEADAYAMSFDTTTTEATVGLTASADDRLGSLRSVPEGAGITPEGECLSPPTPAVLADRMSGYAQPLALGRASTPGYGAQRYGSARKPMETGFPYKERVLRHYDKHYRTPEKPSVTSPRGSPSKVSGSGRDAVAGQPKSPELL